jgi:hypothetical protein
MGGPNALELGTMGMAIETDQSIHIKTTNHMGLCGVWTQTVGKPATVGRFPWTRGELLPNILTF